MGDGTVETEIVALAQEWSRAIVADDAERIGGYMTDDRVIVSWSGVTPREEFLSYVCSARWATRRWTRRASHACASPATRPC